MEEEIKTEELKEDTFNESFQDQEDDDKFDHDSSDEEAAAELFKENPLKAIWIKLGNIEEELLDIRESLEEEGEEDEP